MRQIQKVVLNNLKPGKVPIIIVSPTLQDGHPLAYLLSDTLNPHNNYNGSDGNSKYSLFLNEEIATMLDAISHDNHKKLEEQKKSLKSQAFDLLGLQPTKAENDNKAENIDSLKQGSKNTLVSDGNDKQKNPEDFRKTFKFLFDINFANKKIIGLQLDYHTFIDHKLGDLFPNAFFIFQYGTGSASQEKKFENYLQSIADFHDAHENDSIVLHIKNVLYTPELVMQVLPVSDSVKAKYIDNDFFLRLSHNHFFTKDFDHPIVKNLDSKNPVLRLENVFVGSDVAIIIIFNEYSQKRILEDKIFQYQNTFVKPPIIQIICTSDLEKLQVERTINKSKNHITRVNVISCSSGIAATLNDIIHACDCNYIIVDDLQQSFSLSQSLAEFKKDPDTKLVTGIFEVHRVNEPIETPLLLQDILATAAVINNLIFIRATWKDCQGFDENLDHYISIWDFAIRALEQPESNALQNDSRINKPVLEYADIQSKMIPYEGYKKIVKKHQPLFEKHLLSIVKSYSEHQYVPQYEVMAANEKIHNLKSLLSHSKYEQKSINELNIQLQQHIQLIESRWYFKLAHKIGKLKKIFFKENASNKTGILKILKFIVFSFTKPGFNIFRKVIKGGFKKLYLVIEDRPVQIVYLDTGTNQTVGIQTYNDWIHKKLDPETLHKDFEATMPSLSLQPKISIVMPVYNPPIHYLKEAIESVLNQSYKNWELCIADDCSPNPQVARLLNTYAIKDSRIKFVIRTENGHISASSNSALAIATGDYILFMDHDDLITSNCCFEVVKYINEHPDNSDIIYSDEDKIDEHNIHSAPHFKPEWAPDNLLSRNYFGHVVVMKKELVDNVGGFRLGFEGSQDYDIILRATEASEKIGHIPKVLYHWRIHQLSAAHGEDVKPYAYIAAKKALEEALMRRNTPGDIQYLAGLRGYRVIYDIVKPGKVSVIIPTKDHTKLLKNTIDSIIQKTTYSDYEIIVLNNNSTTDDFFEFKDEYNKKYASFFRCIDANFPFNFSKLMNIGFAESKGDYILLLNNDMEIIDGEWMTTMVSYAQHDRIGIVGAKLLYPDDTIQHAGVLVGLGGVAGHAFTHAHKDDPGYFNYIQSLNNYSALTAACIMCRREVYEEVNGMEESFEVEYNDVDFCLKVLVKGYYNVYVPDVVLYHYESATRGHPHQNKESYARHVREIALFKEKWSKYIENDPYYNPNLNRGVHDFSMDFSK